MGGGWLLQWLLSVVAVYEPDEWEVVRENIKLLSELGQGSHRMVYEGTAHNIKDKADIVSVAVKASNSPHNTSCASRRSCVVCICD